MEALRDANAASKQKSLIFDSYLVLGALAFAVLAVSGLVTNILVYPRVAEYYGFAREIATLAGGCAYLAALLIARFKPELMYTGRTSITFIVLCVGAVPLLAFALETSNPALTVVALCIRSVSRAWAFTLLVAVLVRMKDVRLVPAAAIFGPLCAALVKPLLVTFNTPLLAASGQCLTNVLAIAMLTFAARPVLDRVRTGEAADLMELLHPRAFLSLTHGFFICTLIFAVASGFALTFREVGNAPIYTSVFALFLLFVVVCLVAIFGDRQEDSLFSFSVVLVMAGFLLVPVVAGTDVDAANTLIDVGETCFEALLWLMLASIGQRNLFAMLPAFGFVMFCDALGTDIGATAGRMADTMALGNNQTMLLISLGFVFVLFLFLWLGFRNFSFTRVVHDIESTPLKESDVSCELTEEAALGHSSAAVMPETGANQEELAFENAQAAAPISIEQRCAEVGASHGLTPREIEIFTMLARGRNAGFIMDELVLSRNTVKSHIKHIYAKLDVHSQQELIDLVEL